MAQEAAALAQQQRARQTAPGDSSSAYTPSGNVAALSGEQPGPHPGLSEPSSVGSDGGAGPRRLRSRPSSVDETVATGAKPTALRGASPNDEAVVAALAPGASTPPAEGSVVLSPSSSESSSSSSSSSDELSASCGVHGMGGIFGQ